MKHLIRFRRSGWVDGGGEEEEEGGGRRGMVAVNVSRAGRECRGNNSSSVCLAPKEENRAELFSIPRPEARAGDVT